MESDYLKIKRAEATGVRPDGFIRIHSQLYSNMLMMGSVGGGVLGVLALTTLFPTAPLAVIGVSAIFGGAGGLGSANLTGQFLLKNKRYSYKPDPNRCTLKHKI